METVSATEARVHFGELMQRAIQSGQPIIVEKTGEPQIVLLSLAAYNRLIAQDRPGWQALLEETQQLVQAELAGKELTPAEDIIAQMREERTAELY